MNPTIIEIWTSIHKIGRPECGTHLCETNESNHFQSNLGRRQNIFLKDKCPELLVHFVLLSQDEWLGLGDKLKAFLHFVQYQKYQNNMARETGESTY